MMFKRKTREEKMPGMKFKVIGKGAEKLRELARKTGLAPDELLTRAVNLYEHVIEETSDGKRQLAFYEKEINTIILVEFASFSGNTTGQT